MDWVKTRVKVVETLHLQFLVVQLLQRLVVAVAALILILVAVLEMLVDLVAAVDQVLIQIIILVDLKMEVEQHLVLQNHHH